MRMNTLDGDEVLIKVAYAGICPWDVRAFSGLSASVAFLRVLGHELAGIVVEVCRNTKVIKPDQRVEPDMGINCDVCKACRSGSENFCQTQVFSFHSPENRCRAVLSW